VDRSARSLGPPRVAEARNRDANLRCGADPEDLEGFVKVRSEFYPDITGWYDAQAAAWLAAVQAERSGDEDDDGEE
jgi:hypothetical protein